MKNCSAPEWFEDAFCHKTNVSDPTGMADLLWNGMSDDERKVASEIAREDIHEAFRWCTQYNFMKGVPFDSLERRRADTLIDIFETLSIRKKVGPLAALLCKFRHLHLLFLPRTLIMTMFNFVLFSFFLAMNFFAYEKLDIPYALMTFSAFVTILNVEDAYRGHSKWIMSSIFFIASASSLLMYIYGPISSLIYIVNSMKILIFLLSLIFCFFILDSFGRWTLIASAIPAATKSILKSPRSDLGASDKKDFLSWDDLAEKVRFAHAKDEAEILISETNSGSETKRKRI